MASGSRIVVFRYSFDFGLEEPTTLMIYRVTEETYFDAPKAALVRVQMENSSKCKKCIWKSHETVYQQRRRIFDLVFLFFIFCYFVVAPIPHYKRSKDDIWLLLADASTGFWLFHVALHVRQNDFRM